ncbi:hypothetical protein ILUMI_26329 [Ignelater luminosus]|uniref:Uncharacterized protein n=1 Tax=Ignelater luminosus TaxID=2038154 RepID=A0A8K0C3V8_IGNLU|nr:hypothetical protein ILUMI_26329 [Ignelater luminosus]
MSCRYDAVDLSKKVLGLSTYNSKIDDYHIKFKNAIPNGAPVTSIKNDYKDFSYIYDQTAFYDIDNSSYSLEKLNYSKTMPVEPQKTAIVYIQKQKASDIKEIEINKLKTLTKNNFKRIENNPHMMDISKEFQGFAVLGNYYYNVIKDEENRQRDLEKQDITANAFDSLEKFLYGGRAKRSFSKLLNLKNKIENNAPYFKVRKINGNADSVIQNADCRGYGGTQNSGNRRRNNADAANTVVQVARTTQDISRTVANSTGDIVDVVAEVVQNLVNGNTRNNNRGNGNNRNERG